MKLRILLAAFVAAPFAAMAQPADQPEANPNPFGQPLCRGPGILQTATGPQHGFLQRGGRRFPWSYLGRGPLRRQRCCVGSNLDPIMEFDAKGNFIKAFGAGLLLFPHGFSIDSQDHLWITDGVPAVERRLGDACWSLIQTANCCAPWASPAYPARTQTVSPNPMRCWWRPTAASLWLDGHTPRTRAMPRVIKFDANGKFLMQWGGHGNGPGQFDMPHCLAMDSKGRLYVGDRGNNRIQVFTQDGKFFGQFTQFGRPSGIVDRPQ